MGRTPQSKPPGAEPCLSAVISLGSVRLSCCWQLCICAGGQCAAEIVAAGCKAESHAILTACAVDTVYKYMQHPSLTRMRSPSSVGQKVPTSPVVQRIVRFVMVLLYPTQRWPSSCCQIKAGRRHLRCVLTWVANSAGAQTTKTNGRRDVISICEMALFSFYDT